MRLFRHLVLYETAIPAQSRIIALSSTAIRDPDRFPNPDTPSLSRHNKSHDHKPARGKDKNLSNQLCLQLSVAAIEALLISFRNIDLSRESSPELTRTFLTLRYERIMLSVSR